MQPITNFIFYSFEQGSQYGMQQMSSVQADSWSWWLEQLSMMTRADHHDDTADDHDDSADNHDGLSR
jgi:hypothetical protein